jgi:hypothetical protein
MRQYMILTTYCAAGAKRGGDSHPAYLLLRLARRRRRAHGSTLQNTDPASHSDKGDLCFWSLEEIRVDLLALGREG